MGSQEARQDVVAGRGEGESIANLWARLLEECQRGPIELEDKRGTKIAVMVSMNEWVAIQRELAELEERRDGTLGSIE